MRRTLICEICDTPIGSFDDEKLSLPLQPGMFEPLEEGFPAPFFPEQDWEYFLCPTCHKRAMGWDESAPEGVRRDRMKTETGYFVVEPPKESAPPAPEVKKAPVKRTPKAKPAKKTAKKTVKKVSKRG